MRSFLILVLILLAGFQMSCGFFSQLKENSLTHLSKLTSSQTFTEEQQEDLKELIKELHSYTLSDEDCNRVRAALDNNQTILDFEKTFNLRPFFIYDEFLYIETEDLTSSSETAERNAALKILAAWKEHGTTEQLNAIIIKVRKCYPDDLRR